MKPPSIQSNALNTPSRKYARALRVAIWNAALIIAGLLLTALAGEVYLRLANPFLETSVPSRFVDGIGIIRNSNSEIYYANWDDDNFVVSRANSQGFLDREPVSPERAATGCHIAFIGDSFVEAMQVQIADKFHVRLEEMAARELPHLDITTQAYGISNTGQINQIPLYDEYARHLRPKLVVLVFYINDFANNSTALQALAYGADPDKMLFQFAQRDARGTLRLRPPDPDYERFLLPTLPKPWHWKTWERLVSVSYLAKWVDTKSLWKYDPDPQIRAWTDIIAKRPCCAALLDSWQPARLYTSNMQFTKENLLPVHEEALEYTAFGIEQFKRRADRDGVNLAILAATRHMGTRGDPQFDRISAIAKALGIPIISQYEYVVSQGHNYQDARWLSDAHWNATGHQWAAEAILEWLKENQDVCD